MMQVAIIYNEYNKMLCCIGKVLNDHNVVYCIIGGDLNTDLSRHRSSNTISLNNFVISENLNCKKKQAMYNLHIQVIMGTHL